MPISILFLSLARNCAGTIPLFFEYIQQLESDNFKCHAIIGENGSSDGTRALIERAVGKNISFLDTGEMAAGGSRLVRMAIGRQSLLNAALALGIRENYVCVVDLDNVLTALPAPAAVQAAIARLQADSTLFAVGAASDPVYYDVLSLRIEGFEFLSNLSSEIEEAKKKPLTYYRFHKERIYATQKLLTSAEPLLCASSFNGFCLYNAADYRLGSYRASDEAEVCEHVSLNLAIGLRTRKRMLISPDLRIQAPADHIPVGLIRFWFDRTRKLLRKARKMHPRG
jgi:hypothetical protein